MTEEIQQLLKNLRLHKIAEIIEGELAAAGTTSPSYSDLLARLLRAEWLDQQERRLQSRFKHAHLPEQWTLESFPFKQQPGVSRRQIRELAELEFIPKAVNLVFIGPTGVRQNGTGVRALAEGFAERLSRAVHPRSGPVRRDVRFPRRPRLAQTHPTLGASRLPFIDEVGYLNLRPEQTNIFFKLMEERCRRKATLITTNLEYDQWARLLGNKDLTEALLSRLRHQCQTIRINGPSLREPQG